MEKLKQRVASSSSRVIASLQQVATGTFQSQQGSSNQDTAEAPNSTPQQGKRQQLQVGNEQLPVVSASAASLMTADATAHLTKEERKILMEVFKKEEQFQRDTIKQMRAIQTAPDQPQNEPPTQADPYSGKQNRSYNKNRRQSGALPWPTSGGGVSTGSGTRLPAATARSATPHSQQQQQRAPSSCSIATLASTTAASQQPPDAPLGQCRICRKYIFANETCHLCSACDQFVCEDCGSYSATDQHWMCSSCRRRATKPALSAIPADALKELNQNSSAVRRMTLRLNQAELARATTAKRLSVSSASSSSSSGCSSAQSTTVTTSGGRYAATSKQQKLITQPPCQQAGSREPAAIYEQRLEPEVSELSAPPKTKTSGGHCAGGRNQAQATRPADGSGSGLNFGYGRGMVDRDDGGRGQQQQQSSQIGASQPFSQVKRAMCDRRGTSTSLHRRIEESTAYSDGRQLELQQSQTSDNKLATRNDQSAPGRGQGASQKRQSPRNHHQLLARRASVANVLTLEQGQAVSGSLSAGLAASMQRPQSKPTFLARDPHETPSSRLQHAVGGQDHRHQPTYGLEQQVRPPLTFSSQRLYQQKQQFTTQPQTIVTCDLSMGGCTADSQELATATRSLAAESAAAAYHQYPATSGMLVPVSLEQLHVRRLSDQTNLVRRSSIVSETIESVAPFTRNRSHSNIDTLENLTYMNQLAAHQASNFLLQQQPQPQHHFTGSQQHGALQQRSQFRVMSAEDNSSFGSHGVEHQKLSVIGYANQQRRPSDQWVIQQHVAAQQEALGYAVANEYQQQNTKISAIITPYAKKKQRQTSADAHSDSSSDIDEDLRDPQAGLDYNDNEQPSEYFAPPRVAQHTYFEQQYQQQHGFATGAGQPISIPSVSVSEFSSSQQRLSQVDIQQLQQRPPHCYQDKIMTTPMQINLAIEQAIQQQQRRLSNEFLSSGGGQGYLMARRGSSGRLLPKTPGEQSRSLLELPLNSGDQKGASGGTDMTTLDLPTLSPTIRRASAPEGQNIKIVVDDLEPSMGGKQSGRGKMKGELYERLVLYRDESLDPSTGMAHGFGLQVMGGKLDTDNRLHALVSWIMPAGPSDKVGLRVGDELIEWDGKSLVNMSYEQVADVIESSANIAELLVRPARRLDTQPSGSNLVRSQRRMSQQTQFDLKRAQDPFEANSYSRGHRLSYAGGQMPDSIQLQAGMNQRQAGTGRRLPQIPGTSLAAGKTGSQYQAGQSANLLGLGPNYNQQSLSASELYPAGSQLYAPIANQAASVDALNPVPAVDQWQNPGVHPSALTTRSTINAGYLSNEFCGLIGLQVSVDERVPQLEVCVLSAINIDKNPSLEYYVRVRVLPESKHFKACTTQPSSDMNWKETFIFQNFPIQQIQRMALEVGIWVYDEAPRLSAYQKQPLCEALIPIQSAQERNTDFWPLRPPVTSPQSRRKSLNDLMENLHLNGGLQFAAGCPPHEPTSQRASCQAINPDSTLRIQGPANELGAARGRSLSNKNLPETGRLRVQPRRASDELASGGSSPHHRFISCRTSPATSKRSISVIDVGNGSQSVESTSSAVAGTIGADRPQSRSGGGVVSAVSAGGSPLPAQQAKIGLSRRDPVTGQQKQPSNDSPVAAVAGATKFSVPLSNGNEAAAAATPPRAACNPPEPAAPATSCGRRYSLVGIQSMSSYRSQQSSGQSGSTDQDSPRRLASKWPPFGGGPIQQSAFVQPTNAGMEASKQHQHHRGSIAGGSSGITGSGSRRGSIEQGGPQYQRKGSFAMQTLRKLKRTMSLTKGGESDPDGNQGGHWSSSTSADDSHHDSAEDVGLSRRLLSHRDYVGKLKLGFILTKGQLEIDVIAAQGLHFEPDFCLGLYVKVYLTLNGKTRTYKRKTRIVQPTESPVFKQLIKYDGSLVDNKALDISVWQKQSGLKGKVPIGFTMVQLAKLNLEQQQTSWYNLRPMEIAYNSSIDD